MNLLNLFFTSRIISVNELCIWFSIIITLVMPWGNVVLGQDDYESGGGQLKETDLTKGADLLDDEVAVPAIANIKQPLIYGVSPQHGEAVRYKNILDGIPIDPFQEIERGVNMEDFASNAVQSENDTAGNEGEGVKGRFLGSIIVLPRFFPSFQDKAQMTQYLIRTPNGLVPMNRNPKVMNKNWKKDGRVVILLHGYTPPELFPNSDTTLKITKMIAISKALAEVNSTYNIIVVNWFKASAYIFPLYWKAVQGMYHVGEDVGKFLLKLKELNMITEWENVYIVGYSLGGQLAGVVGSWLQKNGGGMIGRITGIDPADPLFEVNNGEMLPDKDKTIDPSDAKFVDIMHCNIKNAIGTLGRLGTRVQSGHADFYFNGGESQPGYCNPLLDLAGCSHFECPNFYLRSIREDIQACPCDSWKKYKRGECKCDEKVLVGYQTPPMASGKYQVRI